jgi:phosphotransferase system  glucose/maltose/N-acetylglucosamine-specific IIC component
MLERLVTPITILITALVVAGMFRWIKSANEKAEKAAEGLEQVTVTLPKLYRWVGIVTTALFLGFAIVMSLTAGEDFSFPALIIFLLFSLMGVPLIIASSLWHIDVVRGSDTFVYRTSFGKTYTVRYDEIQFYDLRTASRQVILKTAERKYYVDLNATHLDTFTDEMLLHGVKERQELRS